MATQSKGWLATLFAKVLAFFSGASDKIHDLTVLADNIANAIKNAEASAVGQLLETTLEMVIPASTGLVNAFKEWLPVIVLKLNWAVAEEGKTDEQKISDALAYLATIKSSDPDVYASQLNTLNALIQKWLSDSQGEGLTIEQALITPQVVHNPALLASVVVPTIETTATEPVETEAAPTETPDTSVINTPAEYGN